MKIFQSKYILWLCYVVILWTSFFYYPKWKKDRTEATISWDVSGYYWYLPAYFIYNDLKKQDFKDDILKKYHPTPELQQSYLHSSGNYINKYSLGLSIHYFPGFIIADVIARNSEHHLRDGFSTPYQLSVQITGILFCLIGLWFLRKILLVYFPDNVVSLTLICLILGSNYLNFSAIDTAMSHNFLFTWYAILIYLSIRYYNDRGIAKAIGIGGVIGIMTLSRPTELISVIIPLLWGISILNKSAIYSRVGWIIKYAQDYIIAILTGFTIISLQLIYWKYTGGDWIIYSYEDQGFSWFSPHLKNYLLSFRCGWLIYTPIMLLCIIGAIQLRKRPELSITVLYAIVFLYIVMAWDIWWYGGRAMVQSYPILCFLMASAISYMLKANILRYILLTFITICIYYNVWWTHQIHRGGLVSAYDMTQAYYMKVVGRWSAPDNYKKLYDTDELYTAELIDSSLIYENDFDNKKDLYARDTIGVNYAEWLDENRLQSEEYFFTIDSDTEWIRVSALIKSWIKEWDKWKMARMKIQLYRENMVIKERNIRLHRFINNHEKKRIYMDFNLDNLAIDSIGISYDHNSDKKILIDEMQVYSIR